MQVEVWQIEVIFLPFLLQVECEGDALGRLAELKVPLNCDCFGVVLGLSVRRLDDEASDSSELGKIEREVDPEFISIGSVLDLAVRFFTVVVQVGERALKRFD